jgi:5-methylcytosine-specific restriction protein A
MKNPPWVREEAILLLDLYIQCGRQQLPANDERVITLSELLRNLPFHTPGTRTSSFRNPTGISMKMGNLLALDPLYDGVGLDSASKLDRQIWDEFADNPDGLHSAAQAIRATANSTIQHS